jgi:hypothetical protein
VSKQFPINRRPPVVFWLSAPKVRFESEKIYIYIFLPPFPSALLAMVTSIWHQVLVLVQQVDSITDQVDKQQRTKTAQIGLRAENLMVFFFFFFDPNIALYLTRCFGVDRRLKSCWIDWSVDTQECGNESLQLSLHLSIARLLY